MNQLVTGEAVALDLRLAKLPSRAAAFLIDLAVQLTALFLMIILLGIFSVQLDEAATFAVMLSMVLAIIVGYPTMIETFTHGRSLGKLALGLRVVRSDGGPVRFRHALVRALCGFFELWATGGFIATLTSLINQRGQRVGDLLAGTVAVAERQHIKNPPASVSMPSGLQGWASTLDLSALNGQDATSASQVIRRWHHLAPQAREVMAAELAQRITRQVFPAPPAGVPPVAYLAAVLAERTRRATTSATGTPSAMPPSPPAGFFSPSSPDALNSPGPDSHSPALPPPADEHRRPPSWQPDHGWKLE